MTAAWRTWLAEELAREALFDEGVEAARNACVAGASIAAAAITAAAWYDNPLTGAPALRAFLARLAVLPESIEAWQEALRRAPHPDTLDPDHSPGFGFVPEAQQRAVLAACERFCGLPAASPRTRFFLRHQASITLATGPLNAVGLSALVCADRDVAVDVAEREYLLIRISIAMREAERARRAGVGAFPFFSEAYVYEGSRPAQRRFDLAALLERVGLE